MNDPAIVDDPVYMQTEQSPWLPLRAATRKMLAETPMLIAVGFLEGGSR